MGTPAESAQAGAVSAPGFLRCPGCGHALGSEEACRGCGRSYPTIDGVRVLVADRDAVERAIAEAKAAGRAGWYEERQDSQLTGPYRHHLAKRRRYLDEALGRLGLRASPATAAVDIGCGDGLHLEWLSGYANDVFGSDYNLTRLRRAAERAPVAGRLFLADVTAYPAADEAFDLVFMNHVLEHVPDDALALAEVYRILRPGGTAVIGVPNEGAGWWRLAYRLQPGSRAASDHVHFYTADSLAARCRSAGFEVREVEGLGWGLPHWSLDARVRGRRWVDDAFERVGRRVIPGQASSLYIVLGK